MAWPVPQDYNEAIQNPSTSFADAELRRCRPVINALGLPFPCSGSFADVYELYSSERRWAVKCFTRQVPGLRERYSAASGHLSEAPLPFFVPFRYLDQGIRVCGQWYPIVQMDWVEGLLLNEFVRQNADRPANLGALLEIWVRLARRLREAEVAHGDLQHGNVLLVPGTTSRALALRLVDYDGIWVPALAERVPGEAGHPAYQHPRRCSEVVYGPEMDRFPLLVVATALRCLSVGGAALWKRYDNGDNLLFREADLRAPRESSLFHELWQLDDPQAHALVGRLLLATGEPPAQTPSLDEVYAGETIAPLSDVQERKVENILGLAHVVRAGVYADYSGGLANPVLVTSGESAQVSTQETHTAVWAETPIKGLPLERSGGLLTRPEPPQRVLRARAVLRRRLQRWAISAVLLALGLIGVGVIAANIKRMAASLPDALSRKPAETSPSASEPPTHPTSQPEQTQSSADAKPQQNASLAPGALAVPASDDQTVRLWDVETGRELHKFLGHTAEVRSVAFSPEGRFAVSGGIDKTVRLWRLSSDDSSATVP
jgi:WD domain, G-beta repeat